MKIKIKIEGLIIILLCLAITTLSPFDINKSHAEQVEFSNEIINEGIENFSNDEVEQNEIVISDDWSNFTNINLIDNANYFMANPKHAQQVKEYNIAGTCTTVAMQMLLGYHNYYTDRRLIPEFAENSERFLSADYGNLLDHPQINSSLAAEYGRASIGTEDEVYEELIAMNLVSNFPALGQAYNAIKDAANSFIHKYASIIEDNVSITWGIISEDEAKADRRL